MQSLTEGGGGVGDGRRGNSWPHCTSPPSPRPPGGGGVESTEEMEGMKRNAFPAFFSDELTLFLCLLSMFKMETILLEVLHLVTNLQYVQMDLILTPHVLKQRK